MQYVLEITTCDPTIKTMDYPHLTIQILWEKMLFCKQGFNSHTVNDFLRKLLVFFLNIKPLWILLPRLRILDNE